MTVTAAQQTTARQDAVQPPPGGQPGPDATARFTLAVQKAKSGDSGGYVPAKADATPPAFHDYKAIGRPGEVGPDTIRYETRDGTKVIVAKATNPDLFDHVSQDFKALSAINKSEGQGYAIANDDAKPPGLNDIKLFSTEDGGIFRYETTDGKKVAISQTLTPELFDKAKALGDTWGRIHKSEANGYTLAGAEDYPKDADIARWGWPDELGPGLIQFETKSGGKFVVSQDINKPLYDRIMAKAEGTQQGQVDDIRKAHGLPPAGDLDVLGLKTDVKSDPDKSDSEPLTVSGLATKSLIEQYRKGVDDGSIAKDDPRAKLVRALEAKAATQSGRGIIGYEEGQGAFGGTWRNSDDKQTQLTAADLQDIIDGGDLDASLTKLFSDETIAKDYQAKLTDALGHIPDRAGLTQKLETLLNGKDGDDTSYLDYIQDLKGKGLDHAAQADIATMIQSLTLLDPEKGKAAAQRLQADSLTADLNQLVGDPSKVSDENKLQATKDLFGLLKGVLKAEGLDLPRRTIETIEKFVEEFVNGNVDQKKVIEAVQGAAKEAAENGGRIPAASLDKYKAYVPLKDQAGFLGFLGGLNEKGVLGSVGGGISLFSGIYQLVGKGGKLGDDPLERLSIAKDFISFAGASSHFIKTGDAIFSALGKGGLVDMLGLTKSVPEIWGSQGLWGKKLEEAKASVAPKVPAPDLGSNFAATMGDEIDKIFTKYDAGHPKPTPDTVAGLNGDDATKGVTDLLNGQIKGDAPKIDPGRAAKIAGSAVKVIGALSDGVGGVADIVLGAFTIKSGVQSGSELQKAQGALQVISGVAGGAAGAIGIAGLFGPVAAGLSAAAGPLFLVGIALAGIGAIIGFFVDHEKKQKATDKEGQWYKDLAADGLLQDDWGDKVEYARYSIHHYGGRDAPADQSLYDYQSAEWQHFKDTPQKDGSSSNRLDPKLHEGGSSSDKPGDEDKGGSDRPPRGGGGPGAKVI
ncbi:MAG: hypothetical protein JF625_16835 [Inquilinus limosus]|uniref:Uncharacterized protein n=1 Tax=Inquilinus limosus TaxID=171674 RepID=A0A952FLD2_9PROT|nr:hypothetical protein [Inquilinus limosus]